jgi:hypothetical protein
LFLTLPTRALTGQQIISSEGKGEICLGKAVCPGSARNIKLFSASARGPVLGAVSQRSDARSEFSSSLGTDPFRQHNGRPGVRGRTSHRS